MSVPAKLISHGSDRDATGISTLSGFLKVSYSYNPLITPLSHLPSSMPLNREKVVDWPDNLPFDRQSIPVPGTKRPGQTGL